MPASLAANALARPSLLRAVARRIDDAIALLSRIPHSFIALLARFSLAMTFWLSGQTKVEGFVVDPIGRTFHLGVPHLSENALELFRTEYALPLLPPDVAALMAATAEHVFPILLLLGLATRFSALALLGMTLVIQLFVYPDAFPTHGLWAAVMLYLMARGPGVGWVEQRSARRGERRVRSA